MKLKLFTTLFLLAASRAFSQQCIGDACAIVTVKKNPTPTISWRFTNNSDASIKIGIKRDLGGCSNPNFYIIAAHQQFNWGIGVQDFCLPFEANFITQNTFKTQVPRSADRPAGSPPQ